MNNVYVAGNLVTDPNIRLVGDSMKVATVSIGVKDAGKKNTTSFYDLTFWNKSAEIVTKYFTRGQKIAILGHLKQETWNDKKTNAKVSKVTVVADEILNLPQFDENKTVNEEIEEESVSF